MHGNAHLWLFVDDSRSKGTNSMQCDIRDLKAEGLRVFVRHKRLYKDFENTLNVLGDFSVQRKVDTDQYRNVLFSRQEAIERDLKNVLPRGGSTEVDIYLGDDLVGHGEAFCSPNEQFSKKLGRCIAIGRAMRHHR